MAFIAEFAEFLFAIDVFEVLRVVWMEVAIASVAATVYFTLTGWVALPGGKKVDAAPPKTSQVPIGKGANQQSTPYQLATKTLRQGNVISAIVLLQQLPETIDGSVPPAIAPRLLIAAAKASNFDEVMIELRSLSGKIETRSFEAAVMEAIKNKDIASCRQLYVISRQMEITSSPQTLETLARALASDADFLRTLVEDSEAPLPRQVAKVVLEACTALKDIDLAAEVFEKVAESDTTMLRDIVEKAATNPTNAGCPEGSLPAHGKDIRTGAGLIRTCGKSGDLKGALETFDQYKHSPNTLMYNSIIDACVECGSFEKAMEYFSEARTSGFVDVSSYNVAMKGYLSQGQVSSARGLLEELSEKGLAPTIASYHCLLNFHVNARDLNSTWKVVDDMQTAGISPTAITCSILLKGQLESAADVNKVLSIVDAIDPMDEVLFAALADACIRTKQLHLLSKYQVRFSSQGNSPSLAAPTYGSMIKAYGQVRDVQRVWELWEEMTRQRVEPTAITLGCMIEALVTNWRTADAWKLVQDMQREESTKALVNTVIYSTILKGFANAKETDKVMALYDEMRANGIHPNNITFNTILNAFAQGGAMDRVPALLQDMKSVVPPADPDIVTYSTIVKGYCNSGNLDCALGIFKEMQSDGRIAPDEVMFNSLLDGCAKEHRPNDALKLLEDMKKLFVAPSNYTMSIMVKLMGRCRRLKQAFSIIEDISHEYGLKVNIQVYTCLIQACFNNRQATKAVALHEQIIAEGLIPDEMTYSALVKGCIQAGLVDKAVHLTKCAHGLASPAARGTPPGINDRCLKELATALGDLQGKALLAELAATQVGSSAAKGKGKGSHKGHPWQQRR